MKNEPVPDQSAESARMTPADWKRVREELQRLMRKVAEIRARHSDGSTATNEGGTASG